MKEKEELTERQKFLKYQELRFGENFMDKKNITENLTINELFRGGNEKIKVKFPKAIPVFDFCSFFLALKKLTAMDDRWEDGLIWLTSPDICRYGYGEENPSAEMMKRIEEMLDIIHHNTIRFTFPDCESEASFCGYMSIRRRVGEETWYLVFVNDIFLRYMEDFPNNL